MSSPIEISGHKWVQHNRSSVRMSSVQETQCMQTGYAMIVGAGSGTGAAVAKRLAAEGWPMVLTLTHRY
ncbi:hypothetical protein CKO42_24405 [Lamprobacter modestohalophilus]|uniref:SDR family NAD(P)-dependent oxidoreductase n=1 Tax=Lamprobacter modestohalophilus TaxID=1064514 RepID=A0A9X1B6D4_9GAMM|nr:hypothetical protein [Lamprobacter modestohalophilus]